MFDTTVHTLAIVYHNILFFDIYHIIKRIDNLLKLCKRRCIRENDKNVSTKQ